MAVILMPAARASTELSKTRQFFFTDFTRPVSFSRGNVAENVVLIGITY
jgi:hypothetical protein